MPPMKHASAESLVGGNRRAYLHARTDQPRVATDCLSLEICGMDRRMIGITGFIRPEADARARSRLFPNETNETSLLNPMKPIPNPTTTPTARSPAVKGSRGRSGIGEWSNGRLVDRASENLSLGRYDLLARTDKPRAATDSLSLEIPVSDFGSPVKGSICGDDDRRALRFLAHQGHF